MKDLFIAAALAYAVYYRFYAKENTNAGADNQGKESVFPMKIGDSGAFIRSLQQAILNKGGIAAELILKSGGANGKFSNNVANALTTIGAPKVLGEVDYRNIVDNTLVVRDHAYVGASNGTKIYAATGTTFLPGYGYGREEITGVPHRTFLGKATGNYKNGMLQVATTINAKSIKFWINTKDLILISKEEYDQLRYSEILEKSDKVKQALLWKN